MKFFNKGKKLAKSSLEKVLIEKTFDDPTTFEKKNITDKNANFYLVEIDQEKKIFRVGGIIGDLSRDIQSDPFTRVKKYWPIDKSLIANPLLFDDKNNLKTSSLTLKQVKDTFQFTPAEEQAQAFGTSMSNAHTQERLDDNSNISERDEQQSLMNFNRNPIRRFIATSFHLHRRMVGARAIMSNGNIIIGEGSFDGEIQIYNPTTLALVKKFSQHGNGVNALAILANGNIVAGGQSSYAPIRIYNPRTGSLIKSFSQNGNGVNAMAVLPDGNIVVGGASFDARIRIFNPTTGTLVKSFSQNRDGVNALAVLPDGNIVVGGGASYASIRIYNPVTGALVKSFSQGGGSINALGVLPDGNIVAGGGSFSNALRIYNSTTGSLIRSFSDDRGVHSIAILPNGNIITGGEVGITICIYDPYEGLLQELDGLVRSDEERLNLVFEEEQIDSDDDLDIEDEPPINRPY